MDKKLLFAPLQHHLYYHCIMSWLIGDNYYFNFKIHIGQINNFFLYSGCFYFVIWSNLLQQIIFLSSNRYFAFPKWDCSQGRLENRKKALWPSQEHNELNCHKMNFSFLNILLFAFKKALDPQWQFHWELQMYLISFLHSNSQ